MQTFGYVLILLTATFCLTQVNVQRSRLSWSIGPCLLRINEPCKGDEVKFTYHNSNDIAGGRVLDGSSPDAGPSFDPLLPTKVVIHGYDDKDPKGTINKVVTAYRERGDCNVIEVEWWKLSSPALCLPTAALNAPHVGKCVAQFLIGLENNHPGFEPWRIHVVAHSLGAHIAGHASGFIRSVREKRFERITGLDPATPLVSGRGSWWNLDPSDADFVDIVHTSAGILGAIDNIGDVDFYVNGGTFQRGCGILDTQCSHIRAPTLYAESLISTVGFWGVQCQTVHQATRGQQPATVGEQREIMGEYSPDYARGVYYVKTALNSPYALGQN